MPPLACSIGSPPPRRRHDPIRGCRLMTAKPIATSPPAPRGDSWRAAITPYQQTEVGRPLLQLATTLLPLAAVFLAMYALLSVSYWWTLLLALPAAALLVRTFVLMHDC